MRLRKLALLSGDLIVLHISGLALLLGLLVFSSCINENKTMEEIAAGIHEKVLTVDTHCDTPMRMLGEGFDVGLRHDRDSGGGRVDLVRMKEGGLDAMFFAAFVGQSDRDEEGDSRAKQHAIDMIKSIKEGVGAWPELAAVAYAPGDAYHNAKEAKRSIYIGMENGYPVGKNLSNVEMFYDMGVRYITLSHSYNNDICDSSTDPKGTEHNGLSSFGEDVVKEMNRLGMLVDVSHISDSSFYDVLKLSTKPVIASHSCARAICDHPRNLSDTMLKSLAGNGGVIQVCILDSYLKRNPGRDSAWAAIDGKYPVWEKLSEEEKNEVRAEYRNIRKQFPNTASVKNLVDHIDHIVEVAGIDHVGIGSDFDGGGGIIGCEDVSEMGNITLELVNRGYTEEEIEKIWGGNFMRVFREIQVVS